MPATKHPATGHLKLYTDKQGRSTWHVKYRQPDGRQRKQRLAPAWLSRGNPPSGYLTEKQAEGELRKLLADLDRGIGMVVRSGATFDDAVAEYLRYVEVDRELDAVTVSDYRGVLRGYALPHFGATSPIEAMTHREVAAYRDALKQDGRAMRKVEGEPERTGKLSNRTIVRHLVVLHSVFKRAAQVWDGLPPNPASASLVERPRVVYDGSFDLLDPDDVRLLAEQAPDEQTRVMYLLAPFTGLRQGEVFALRWRHVDFASARLHVVENWSGKQLKMTKGKKARSVPMTDEVMALLDGLSQRAALNGSDDLIFPAESGGYLDDMAIRRTFYKHLDAAGLPRVKFHDLRHTFGTQAVKVLPVTDVQAIMGHAHVSTTMRYVHYKPGHDEGAKLAGVFGGDRQGDSSLVPAT